MANNVVIYDVNEDEWQYDNCKAGLAGNGALLVSQMVPDVTGKSETGEVEKLVALFNANHWAHVEYDVCSRD